MKPYTANCIRCGYAGTADEMNLNTYDQAATPPWLVLCADTDSCAQRVQQRERGAFTTAVREIVVALHDAGYRHTLERGEHRWQLNSDQVSRNISHYVIYEPAPEILPGQATLTIRHGSHLVGWDGPLSAGHAADLLVLTGVLGRCLQRECDRLVPGDVVECARCAATSDAVAYDAAVDAAGHGRHSAHEAA
jgi:hypothetical protein